MTLSESERARVEGLEPVLAVEAAAGAGKTHLACELAVTMADSLPLWQSVLILSHTNAARDVFNQRIGVLPRQVSLRTLDSFVLEVLSPYALLLGLPDPLRPPPRPPGDWFLRARMHCLAVLRKKPGLARAIACRFPIIIADEHQDASIHQHEILLELVRAGARLRLFGDALQAILTFDPHIPGWTTLIGDTPTFVLSGLWRWHANQELGLWLASARASLIRGVPIAVGALPDCVRVIRAADPPRTTWQQHPDVRSAIASLEHEEGVVVVVRSNADASQLAADTDLRLLVYEGANPPQIDQLIEAVVGAEGDGESVLDALIDFGGGVGTLMPELAGALKECFHAGGRHERPDVSAVVQHINADPLVTGCMAALREMYDHRVALGWNVSRAASVAALRQLPRLGLNSDNIRDLIYQARRSTEDDVAPPRCVSTIHKIKGREFKHVLIPFLDSRTFASRAADRHLLYVAMSRSMETLTLVIPESSPSPLFEEL
jgi:hypothetical protein